MRFDAPLVLYLAPVTCMMLWGFAIWARARRIGAASRWSDELGAHARAAGWLGTLIIAGAGLIATLGVAGPRWGSRTVVTEAKALNLVLAVDISRSMLAEDEHPSRLEKAKTAASRLVHDLSGDRVGLIAFAGESFVLSPLTQDGGALQLLIEGLHPDMSSAAGTQLQRAIRSARSLLVGEGELADRVLVIFSDGETHDSVDAVQAEASRARREGIKVILVAEGRTEPARIPMYTPDGELSGYYRDENLDFVLTSRRDDILTTVADASQGALVAAEVSDQARTVRSLV
ncbi:MAG: VWA domain-containing protein, partial [Gemmatimonadales bacterium]